MSTAKPLAQRIGAWALNLFASSLVLLAALVFGRQVIQWWREPQAVSHPTVTVPATVGADLASSWLQFGDSPLSVQRLEFSGGVPEVLAQLRRSCRGAVVGPPATAHLPGPAEQRLLERIARQTPVETEPGRWSLFELTEPLPMVALVAGDSASQAIRKNGEPARRVISWGLALPASDLTRRDSSRRESLSDATARWCLFICAEAFPPSSGTVVSMLPQPSHAQRLLTLHAQDGVVVCGWNGAARPDEWVGDFDQWAASQHWQPQGDWGRQGNTWHRRYSKSNRDQFDIQFSRSNDWLRGFGMFVPANPQHNHRGTSQNDGSSKAGSNKP